MKIDELDSLFMKLWKSTVVSNEWQARILHLVFLSQYLGSTVPVNLDDIFTAREPGLRVNLSGKWVHPRLSYFLMQASGTGKGEGHGVVRGLTQYCNMRLFAQRYGITDMNDLWQAYEHYKRARKEATARIRANAEADNDDVADEVKTDETSNGGETAEPEKQAAPKPYRMGPIAQRRFKDTIRNRNGPTWDFFSSDTNVFMPVYVQIQQPTPAVLSGGNEMINGIPRWKKGLLETMSVIAWDEGRTLLTESPDGKMLNSILCSALDDDGKVSTAGRKDLDEFGNPYVGHSNASIITGTIKFDNISQAFGEGGFMQRFILGSRFLEVREQRDLSIQIANMNIDVDTVEKCRRDYYEALLSSTPHVGNMVFSQEATKVCSEYIEKEFEEIIQMFGVGTRAYETAYSYLNRLPAKMKKIASIIASLECSAIVEEKHMRKAYDYAERAIMDGMLDLVDECTDQKITTTDRVKLEADAILAKIVNDEQQIGKTVGVEENRLVEMARLNPLWPRPGWLATKKFIERWAYRHSATVVKSIKGELLYYGQRAITKEYKDEIDKQMARQLQDYGIQSKKELNWNKVGKAPAVPQPEAKPEIPPVPPSAPDEANDEETQKLADDALRVDKERTSQKGEKK